MQKSPNFTVPSEVDLFSEDVAEAGTIINSDININSDSSNTNQIKSDSPVISNISDKQPSNGENKSIDEKASSGDLSKCNSSNSVLSSESTRFGAAFSNLKSSKHYDNEIPTTSTTAIIEEKAPKSSGALLVHPKQRGNPLLKNVRNVPWEFNEMEPDYVMGKTTCALFLSIRYHSLYPNYIHERLKALGKAYQLRILLVQVDVIDPSLALKDLSVIAILSDCTLMVAWSPEEAGSYLETYKMFENKSADLIKEKLCSDNFSQIVDCLTTVRSVNKTDAAVLMSSFKTVENVFNATSTDLAICPGIGPLKAKRLHDALHKPVKNDDKL